MRIAQPYSKFNIFNFDTLIFVAYFVSQMNKNSRLAFETKITGLLLVIILIVLASSFIVYRNLDSIVTDISEEVTPDETLIVIKGIVNDITIAENKAKTYSLNQQTEYLNEFNLKTEEVNEKLDLLRKLTGDDVARFNKVQLLDSLIEEKNLVLEEFLIFQDRFRTPEVIEEMIDKVENVNQSENKDTDSKGADDEKKSFFKRIFQKRKDKNGSKNNTEAELEELDKELTKLKTKETKLSEELRSKELDLISKDQAIMQDIREVVQSIEKVESENLEKGILLAEEKSGKTYLWIAIYSIVTCAFLILAGWAVFIYVRKNESYKLEIKKAKTETDLKNQEITSSINYAKRIQSAILPDLSTYNQILPRSFIFYQPKDIVAGDFYWVVKQEDVIYFGVADCTGHGVPGAMVSVVCHNALNRSVREFGLKSPAKILEQTRELVIETLEERDDVVYDGMDIALCKLNLKTGEIEYAGANNSLYIIPKSSATAFTNDNNNLEGANYSIHDGKGNSKLIEIKADKQPIARYHKAEPFTNHKIRLQEGDSIYMFTDGYPDQFGGEKNKKFNYRRFRETLLQNADIDMSLQKNELTRSLKDWMKEMEQIDDICIVGIQF
jgi:serine phosphatase RsbU (regulator of sigma subunit)/CHASE3 domain sensor protein